MKTDIRKHVVALAILTALSPALADMASPYGYCLHLMRPQFRAKADRLLDLMVGAGVGWYRAGIGWEVLGGPGATLDFTVADETIGKAEAKGIGYLPILHYSNPRAPEFLRDHPDEWCAYVTNCVSRYRGRISCWEVWNEVNIAPEIGNQMPPADYARFLKQTAAAIRRTDPLARITTSGFAGIPLDYVKALYEGGAKDAFDVVNVHPYCMPWRPEGVLDVRLERLRELMRDSGDGDKPVWITEIGAKRTKKGIQMRGFPAAALKAVDPARKHWKVLLVEDAPDRQVKVGELIRNELPACTVEVCDFRSLEARLAAGGVEALFFPLDCTYPADAMDAVTDYVARGGTLVDLGGYSMYQPCGWKRTGRVELEKHNGNRDRARLRFDVRFKYNDKRYPSAVDCHATAALEPDGLPPERKIAVRKMTRQRYFVPDGLREGDEFIPLLAGRTKAGLDVCSAVLIRYRSDMKGNLVLGGWSEGRLEAITPAEQGLCVARTLGIAFAEGVEKVSWYSLATSGWGLVDPVRLSGDEEGYRAYGVFVRMRPAGSANVAGAWHDDARETYFPQWRRPEGGVAGMLWSVRPGGGRLRVRIRGNPVFSDHLGNAIPPPLGEEGEGELRLGERPIYFVGGSVEAMPAPAWNAAGREETLRWFLENEYGVRPEAAERPSVSFAPIGEDATMMGGAALRKRVRITCAGPFGTNSFAATAFLPTAAKGPVPSFLLICNRNPDENIDPERIRRTEFWPAEEIVRRGFAAIAFWNGDLAPDRHTGNTVGAFACFDSPGRRRGKSAWGTLSAWAWGASRVMDWIETEPALDAKRVAVVGHSRGGKTALLAGVTDARFAMACVNDSGCSGAKLNRAHLPQSEQIANILQGFHYWFCPAYVAWANRDAEIPFDQHQFLALMAPRLVAVGSAEGDRWAGPDGEEESCRLARPAWADPACVDYHVRPGKHDLNLVDWTAYMDFAVRRGWGTAEGRGGR